MLHGCLTLTPLNDEPSRSLTTLAPETLAAALTFCAERDGASKIDLSQDSARRAGLEAVIGAKTNEANNARDQPRQGLLRHRQGARI